MTVVTVTPTNTPGSLALADLSNVVPATGRTALGLGGLRSPSDGVLTLVNNAGTDFGRLQIGGTTNAFPAIGRLGDLLSVLKADNSGPAPITALYFRGASGTLLSDSADGVACLSNNAHSDFGRLQFGGLTSAFPALRRNGPTLDVRLADDSAYGVITAEYFRGGRGTVLYDPSNGVLRIQNGAGTDFDRLQFGGSSNAFPALQRSGTALKVRAADDSSYSTLAAQDLIAFGVVKTAPFTVATLPSSVAAGAGSRSFVTDATQTLQAGLGLAVVGGGINPVPVYSDGSAAWKIGG